MNQPVLPFALMTEESTPIRVGAQVHLFSPLSFILAFRGPVPGPPGPVLSVRHTLEKLCYHSTASYVLDELAINRWLATTSLRYGTLSTWAAR